MIVAHLHQLPVVYVFIDGEIDANSFATYLTDLDYVLTRAQPFVYLYDTRKGKAPSRQIRLDHAQWIRERERLLRRYCKGYAILLSGILFRFVLASMLALVPLPAPHEVFEDEVQARAWARARLTVP